MRTALCVLFLGGAVAAYGDLVIKDNQSNEIAGSEQTVPSIDRLINTDILPNSGAKGFPKDFGFKYEEGGPKIDLNEDSGRGHGSDIFADKGKGEGQPDRDHHGEDPPPPVPEPTSIATFGSGVLILAFYTRRRWRNSRA